MGNKKESEKKEREAIRLWIIRPRHELFLKRNAEYRPNGVYITYDISHSRSRFRPGLRLERTVR